MDATHHSTIRSMTAPAGTTIKGRYRIEEEIGRGGMSNVYRAFDTTLERDVAVKVMHRDVARDGDHLERFRREARAIAKLSSPHVVGVIDAGEEDDGTPFIVLEYVEGETLKDRIRRMGRLPVTEAVAYAIEIARGLQAAHERDIVHRDVKPQNVLLDEHGVARVTDFGIARSLRDEGLTADGRVLGTTDYVSPEQALGHQVTPQSDIYSLGVVLYEMLTGDVPFHGETQVSVAMHHVRDELPGRPGRPPGDLQRPRGDRRHRDRQGPRRALRGHRRADQRSRGRAGDRVLPQRPDHRRGDDGLPVASRHQAPARAGPHRPPGALDRRHRSADASRSRSPPCCWPTARSAGPGPPVRGPSPASPP